MQCIFTWDEDKRRHPIDRGWFQPVFVNDKRISKVERVALLNRRSDRDCGRNVCALTPDHSGLEVRGAENFTHYLAVFIQKA